jgi:DNA-directed RNA polymerase specialized sigma24 family protein
MIIEAVLKEIADEFTAEEKAILKEKFDPLRRWINGLPEGKDKKLMMHEYNLTIISFISGLRYGRKQKIMD